MKKSKANLISIHGTIKGVLYNNYTGSQPSTGIISFYSLWLFNIYAEYTMQNTRLDEAQAGIKTARRNINTLRYADDTTLIA